MQRVLPDVSHHTHHRRRRVTRGVGAPVDRASRYLGMPFVCEPILQPELRPGDGPGAVVALALAITGAMAWLWVRD